jgi:hypothetical protein
MQVKSGQIYYYRSYDVGDEVDLKLAASLVQGESTPAWFQLRKINRSILIQDAPVVIGLGSWLQDIGGMTLSVRSEAKMWSFGALSICFIFDLPEGMELFKLNRLAGEIDFDQDIQTLSDEKVKSFCDSVKGAIRNFKIWNEYEDYIIYNFQEFTTPIGPKELLENEEVYRLLIGAREENLSDQSKEMARKNVFSFTKNDLVMVDWNSALIYDPVDYKDIADVIEFALIQLLEMRYYDSSLDVKLNALYKSLETKAGQSLLSNKYADLSKEAAKIYIEISEIVEKIENSLKVIGDFYYAQIFRAASDKFRFKDWQQSVDSKLNNLAQVSKLFQGEINERRNQLMEIIIIVLIAIEVVPLLYSVALKILK